MIKKNSLKNDQLLFGGMTYFFFVSNICLSLSHFSSICRGKMTGLGTNESYIGHFEDMKLESFPRVKLVEVCIRFSF
jgi:hypothetical protein